MPQIVKQFIIFIAVVSFIFTITLSGCGKIGDPVPPVRIDAPATTDVIGKKSDCTDYCGNKSDMPETGFTKKD
jgi:hypothetical protein